MRHLLLLLSAVSLSAAPLQNEQLQRYFATKTRLLSEHCLADVSNRDDWERLKLKYREQLFEMLSLSPLPAKTDLHSQVTGTLERDGVRVEKIHFQSLPGLYVTANLYLPQHVTNPLPAILYLCGHGQVKSNGVSYGNKVAYQHHGAWFARNGYAALLVDTVQLGEIEGLHHGTYREGMWWWNSRGYSPAGVEAWNCIRALDYLETRPEIDKDRFGVTGRSGGGAYSWWITALDERIKVSAPVAGITDLQNHVVDGVVDGHCDCMFFVNTYRWDYPLVASLAAPRPLLICNSDKDSIFPLDGVIRTHVQVRRIYDLLGAGSKLGLLITEGPHKDTQDLQLPVFRWFNRQLKGEDPVIEMAARPLFTPAELKVFATLPADERNSRIHETFVPTNSVPDLAELRRILAIETFGAWPGRAAEIVRKTSLNAGAVQRVEFTSEPEVPLQLFYLPSPAAQKVRLQVLSPGGLPDLLASFGEQSFLENSTNAIRAFLIVRSGEDDNPRRNIQVRRRHMLLGETLESARVWDIHQGVALLRSQLSETRGLPLHLEASGRNAANVALYTCMADELPASITLHALPTDDAAAPDYLNFRRFTSLPELLSLLAQRLSVNTSE